MIDEEIKRAKAHFKYGIQCDIFSEPVLSYAKTVLWAFEEIDRQKERFKEMCVKRTKQNERNTKFILRLQTTMTEQKAEIERLIAKVNRLKKYDEERDIRLHARLTENARVEAINEYVERLKEKDGYNNHTFDDCASILLSEAYRKGRDEKTNEIWDTIDRVRDEMVGDNDANKK